MKLSDVYEAAINLVKKEKPELEAKMTKSFGFATGIEFREATLLIGPKTRAPAKKGILLNSICLTLTVCGNKLNLGDLHVGYKSGYKYLN